MKARYAIVASTSRRGDRCAAVQTLHAQAIPPVYMIAINELSNPDGYRKEYLPKAQAAIKQYGETYVAAVDRERLSTALSPKGASSF